MRFAVEFSALGAVNPQDGDTLVAKLHGLLIWRVLPDMGGVRRARPRNM